MYTTALLTIVVLLAAYNTSAAPASSSTSDSTPERNNGKRGLAYTNDTHTLPYSQQGQNSRVSWGYDWYYSRYKTDDNIKNPAITFYPLLFNDAESLAQAWPAAAQQAIDDGADALMSFNEPDLCHDGSACMTVQQSVNAYRRSMQPFAGKARLGAPAMTQNGLDYLQQFFGNCTGCTVDFINIHWYSNRYAFAYLQSFVKQAHAAFPNYPIWLTEVGMDYSEGATSDADTQTFMKRALPWLDAVPYVERYAWFYDGPGYLIDSNGDGLSAQGTLYNTYTAPCSNWDDTGGSGDFECKA